MEPVLPIAKSIVTFVDLARRMPAAQLSKNVQKLSPIQIALALTVIHNKEDIWKNYEMGNDEESEKELHTISMILAGQEEGTPLSRFTIPFFLLSNDMQSLITGIKTTQKQWIQPLIIEEKSTSEFIKDLAGSSLTTEDELTRQLSRDYSTLLDHVKIDNKPVDFTLQGNKPTTWRELIPREIYEFLGNDQTIARSLALCMTQAIAGEPVIKGMELIRDPLIPDAEFYGVNKYPDYALSKVKNEIILTVTTKGALGVWDEDKLKRLAVRNYTMTQVINLNNPNARVKMAITPRDI